MTKLRLNNTNIIGELLPNIFIDNVILESGGSPIMIDDPHIDHPRENRDVISNPSGGSKAEVRLLLKDKIGISGLGSWFANTQLNKYLKIIVMASLSEEITDFLVRTPISSWGGASLGRQDFESAVRWSLNSSGFDRNMVNSNLSIQTKLVGDSELNSSNLNDYERFRDGDGNEVYNIHYATKFEFLDKNPQHLAIFALTCIDVAQLAADYELDLDVSSLNRMSAGTGRMTSQFVINNGGTVSEAVIFYDPQGNVWTGAVHQHPDSGRWMGGRFHSNPLQRYAEGIPESQGTGRGTGFGGGLLSGPVVIPGAQIDTNLLQPRTTGTTITGLGTGNILGVVEDLPTVDTDAGPEAGTLSHPYLERRVVPNTAVQDFRNVEDLPKRLADLTQIDSRFSGLNSLFKKFVRYNLDIADKAAYFSKVCMSRESSNTSDASAEGACSFSFAVDTHRIYRDHTKYPRLLKIHPALISRFKIRQFKVLRRRVITNPGEDNKKGLRVFDKNEPTHVVIANSERSPGRFLDASRPLTQVNVRDGERSLNSIREMNIYSPNSSGVRHFTVSDRGIAAAAFGEYQYGIEIEVEDQLNLYLEEQLESLIIARKNFERYYKKANQPSGRSATPNKIQKDPHVSNSREVSHRNSKGNFDIYANRFTQKFIVEMQREFPTPAQAPWVDSVATYLQVLSIFTESGTLGGILGKLDNEEKFVDSILTPEKMYAFCSPNNGTPMGISAVIGLMNDLIGRIEKLLGIVSGQGTDDSVSPGAKSGLSDGGGGNGARRTNTFKLTHYFDNEVFDTEVRKFSGFDYLNSNSLAGRHGLKFVSGEEFEDRVSRESLKYFQTSDPSLDVSLGFDMSTYTMNDTLERNSMTFFSPSTVYYGLEEEPLDLLETSPRFADPHKFIRVASHIAKFKFSQGGPGSVPVPREALPPILLGSGQRGKEMLTQQIVKDNLDEIFADKGVTVSVREGLDTVAQPLDSNEIFGNQRDEPLDAIEERTNVAFAHTTRDFDTPYSNQLFVRMMFDFVFSNNMKSSLNSSDLGHLNIQNYNLRNPDNGIEKAKDRRRGVGRGLRSRDIAVQLPNQIKSLFLSSVTANQFVKSNYFDMGTPDPLKDPKESISFLLNYMSLVRIEVFEGFRIGDRNEQLMKSDSWGRLTVEKYNNAKEAEQELICRFVPYSRKVYGIFSAEGLELPTYDRHFILSPARGIPRRMTNVLVVDQNRRTNIVNNLSRLTRDSELFSREHISTDIETTPPGRSWMKSIQDKGTHFGVEGDKGTGVDSGAKKGKKPRYVYDPNSGQSGQTFGVQDTDEGPVNNVGGSKKGGGSSKGKGSKKRGGSSKGKGGKKGGGNSKGKGGYDIGGGY